MHPYESRADVAFRRDVLANFECPFVESGVCWNLHPENSRDCWFAHPGPNARPIATAPVPVPFYVCVYHMTNHCRHTKPGDSVAEGRQICPNGMHLSVAEFASLDEFEVRNFNKIREFYGEDPNRECDICLEKVLSHRLSQDRMFALLESCSCTYCSSCLKAWNRIRDDRNGPLKCPKCHVPSRKIIHWPTFVVNHYEKRLLFAGK